MESVKFPRRTTRIVEVEEYLRRLGATASAEPATEVVIGRSNSINEGVLLVDNFEDEAYEFESAPKTADVATQTKWPNLGNRKQTKDVGVQMQNTTNDVGVQMPNTTNPASMLNKIGMIQYPKKKSTSPYPAYPWSLMSEGGPERIQAIRDKWLREHGGPSHKKE